MSIRCPSCWTEKVHAREVKGWKSLVLKSFLAPVRCHHCYHKFHVLRILGLGKKIKPAPVKPQGGVGPADWKAGTFGPRAVSPSRAQSSAEIRRAA